MTISATAGSKFYIGTKAAASTIQEFEADDYTPVKGVDDLGEFGAQAEELTATPVDSGWTRRRKGTSDGGSIELIVLRDPQDPGQKALSAARADTSNIPYNVKVELNDAPEAGGTPSVFYFKAVVLSARNNLGEANNIVKTTFTIGIDGEIFEVEAAPAP